MLRKIIILLFIFSLSSLSFSNLKTIRAADNNPPLYSDINTNQTFNTLEQVNIFETYVTDANGDDLSCNVSWEGGAPAGTDFRSEIVTDHRSFEEIYCGLAWTPTLAQGGSHLGDFTEYDLTLTMSDGIADPVIVPIHLRVNWSLNTAPIISITGSHTVKQNEDIMLSVTGSDPNLNNTFTIDINNPPVSSYFEHDAPNQRYLFTWRPNFNQLGEYNLNFTANDGTSTRTELFLVTVEANGSPPAESGAEAVLILVNKNSPDSIAIGNYYQARRGVPQNQILTLNTTTNDNIIEVDYNAQIRDPIRTYLADNNLKDTIKYIVPTYGIPSKINSKAIDSYLADLFDESAITSMSDGNVSYTMANNPYWKGVEYSQYYINGIHYQPYHFPSGTHTYMVSRLDGTSLKIAKGLVDKALYAGMYTGPTDDNKAYSYGVPYLSNGAAVICDIISKTGYNCTAASGYPAYDITYDPHYDYNSSTTREKYSYYFSCIANPIPCGGSSAQNIANWEAIKNRMQDGKHSLGSQLGGDNPLWLVSPGNEYYDIWGNWRPGAIPFHFQSGTAVHSINNTESWWAAVVANGLAADATAMTGTVSEPYADKLPQPTAFFDYFLNGDKNFSGTTKHYNYAESMYMASPKLKWTNIIIGDPLYKLADTPATDTSPPKIENVVNSCANNKMNISWNNLTAQDGSPEVSYGSVDYGPTNAYGTTIWDETALEYLGVSKKNYLSQHSFEISNIDCSKEYYFRLSAIDPESNLSTHSLVLNQVASPLTTIDENKSDNSSVLDQVAGSSTTIDKSESDNSLVAIEGQTAETTPEIKDEDNQIIAQASDPLKAVEASNVKFEKNTKNYLWAYLALASIVIIFAVVLVLKKRHKSDKTGGSFLEPNSF